MSDDGLTGSPGTDTSDDGLTGSPGTDTSDDGPTERLLGVDVAEDLDVLPDRVQSLLSGVRFGKFVSVGAVGAAFDNTVLTLLELATGLPTILAKAAGAETAILVMFLVNEHWTFRGEGDRDRRSFAGRLVRSHLVRAGGTSVQLLLFAGLYYGLPFEVEVGGVDFWFLVASVVAIGLAMGVNYVFESLFTWQVHRD
jgi:putative flippase GtrA